MEIGEKFACKRHVHEWEWEEQRCSGNNKWCFQCNECKSLTPYVVNEHVLHKHYCVHLANNMVQSSFSTLKPMFWHRFLRPPQESAHIFTAIHLTANHIDVRLQKLFCTPSTMDSKQVRNGSYNSGVLRGFNKSNCGHLKSHALQERAE